MDVIFNCPHCEQELAVDASGIGSEINCPSCGQSLVIPDNTSAATSVREEPHEVQVNPIKASAEAKVERHFSVPQHNRPADALIEKPLPPLEATAKGSGRIHIKTFKRSDCVEVGKDHFDKVVSQFLSDLNEDHIIGIHPINYSHQDLATRDWVADFGVMIVYKD